MAGEYRANVTPLKGEPYTPEEPEEQEDPEQEFVDDGECEFSEDFSDECDDLDVEASSEHGEVVEVNECTEIDEENGVTIITTETTYEDGTVITSTTEIVEE